MISSEIFCPANSNVQGPQIQRQLPVRVQHPEAAKLNRIHVVDTKKKPKPHSKTAEDRSFAKAVSDMQTYHLQQSPREANLTALISRKY